MSTIEHGSLFADRFEIERRAGSGGMGAVFRARDRHTGALVALKLMHRDGAGAEGRERFAREAQLLAEMDHPGIVSYVAHGEAPDGRRFLAMEWLDGEDLAARLERGPLSLTACVALLRRVAEALDVAHRRGVVHRDLKPSNLFLVGGAVAEVKVLDFGVARRRVASRAMTRTGAVVGTPDYMAPEQARRREITPAADVFSLGCVLHECLTGRPPFAAPHIAAVLARILFEDPPPVEALRPGVPAPLSALLRRMLAKRPEERLPDAGALVAALDALGELPDDAAAPACAVRPPSVTITVEREGWAEESAPAPSGPAFAEREQGLFSLVVASAPPVPGAGATLPEEDARQEVERRRDVRKALSAMGLSADFVADGSLVVKVAGSGSALDQVSLAARAALVVRERWPAAEVALATGLGAVEGAFALGEVADRAVRLLTAAETRTGDGGGGPPAPPVNAGGPPHHRSTRGGPPHHRSTRGGPPHHRRAGGRAPPRSIQGFKSAADIELSLVRAAGVPPRARLFDWSYTVDGGETYLAAPSGPSGKTTLHGLTPLRFVGVRVALHGSDGPHAWSQVATILVL